MANTPKTGMAKLAKVQAEVAALGGVDVDLRGEPVGVKAFGDWPMDAVEDLEDSRFRSWSEACLTDEGLEVWQRLRPTVNEVTQFFADWNEASGQDLGK